MTSGIIELGGNIRAVTDAASPRKAFERVEVHARAEAVLAAWAELEAGAPCSIYQTRAFVLPWAETLGRKAGIEPRFVLASDRDGRPAALLLLGLKRRGPFRVATWLGGRDANFNMPLLRRPADWTAAELNRLFTLTAKACAPRRPDAFELGNQPFAWAGAENPLSRLTHTQSPSAAFGTALQPDSAALLATKLSKDTRKKLRKKEAKLASLGRVIYRVASDAEERRTVLDAFLAQKTARFRERGIPSDFETAEMRAFIEAASAPFGAAIELHALWLDERVIAVYGGGSHRDGWSGMFNSFDADEEISKTSPGDLLLMRIVERCCADGFNRLDLGIGEARYKAALCDETIPLFDAFVPVTALGVGYAAAGRARQHLKRAIKRNKRLLALVQRLRAPKR